ncbi:MAG: o-succinylbenzoate synthase [Salinibacter sp.]
MTIVRADCYAYALPLRPPLPLGDDSLTEREGGLLRLEAADGRVGWGDAAPLPGFSAETRTEALAALTERTRSLPGTRLPAEREGPPSVAETAHGPASARFAVEAALVELRGPAGRSVLGKRRRDAVALNALVTDDQEDLRAAGRRLRAAGFQAVKLKVGRRPVDRDVARVRTLADALGPEGTVRLDANRAWTLAEAVAFADAVADLPLAYVEEPLAEPEQLGRLVERTGMPVALDETTRERSPEEEGALPVPVVAVVLKPTLLGGLAPTQRWVRWARSVGASPVVSSSYESGVGTRLFVALAAACSETPAGLSAHMRLRDDVLRPRLALDGPTVGVDRAQEGQVDRSRLSLVQSSSTS